MKNIAQLILIFGIITFTLLTLKIGHADPDRVDSLKLTDDILKSKAAFAVVEEEIALHLNLGILTEWDYQKLHGPVLWKIRAPIHTQLREKFDRIVNTVNFNPQQNYGSLSRSTSMDQGNKPRLHKKASEIIRDFIDHGRISLIVRSDTLIGLGETAAIRRLRGEIRYTYDIINGACITIPTKNLTALIRQPFITEIWPNAKGNLELSDSVPKIGADKVHMGLGVTGEGVHVAVVDGGISSSHSDLEFKDRIVDTRGVIRSQGKNEDKVAIAHGTHVAGIIGADDNQTGVTGVAPNAKLLDARYATSGWLFLDDRIFGTGDYGDAMDAIMWAARTNRFAVANQKADVINMSLGWEVWDYGRSGADLMSDLIDKVVSDGILVVKSAGNTGERRATGDISSNPDPLRYNTAIHYFSIDHRTNGGFYDEVPVTVKLLWNIETSDLDLAVLHSTENKTIANSYAPTPSNGRSDNGDFYEQIDFTSQLDPTGNGISRYKLRVGASFNKVKGIQKYEVWVSRGGNFDKPNPAQTVSVPGYSKKVITVGAIDGNSEIVAYSSQGPSSIGLIKPEILAPGEMIESTLDQGNYGYSSGTSMAAPHVAGVAALILDAVGKNNHKEWNFSPNEVKSAIVRGAEELSHVLDSTYGAGLMRADNIIFGGTIPAGKKLYFKITPRLLKSQFGRYFLNAENTYPNESLASLTAAISWGNNRHDLDLHLSTASQSLTRVDTQTGAGYEKIIFIPVPRVAYYLHVHNKSQESVTFTGAATHPIEKLSDASDLIVRLETVSPIQPSPIGDPDLPSPVGFEQDAWLHATLKGHTSFVSSVAFSPNGKTLVSGSWDKTIRFWDIDTAGHSMTLTGHTDRVTSVTFSPNGNMLVSGSWDKTIRFWNPNSGKFLRGTSTSRVMHETFTSVVPADPDGDSYWFASGSLDDHVWLWYGYGLTSRSNSYKLSGHTHDVSCVAFSADERTLASGSHDNTVKLWDISDRKSRATLKGHTNFVTSVAFSPNGRTLASGSWDNTLILWDVTAGKSIKILKGHTDRVLTVAFSPDGRTLASGSDDQTIRLWDVATGQQLDTLLGHTSGITAVAFSPDRKTLASAGGWDNTVKLWDLSPAPTPAPVVRIAPSPIISPVVGENLVIKVNIGGVQNVAGYQMTVHFDPTALRYVDSTNGTYLPAGALFVPPVVKANQITFAATALSGDSDGAGTLASLTFEVVAVKPSSITLSGVMIMEKDLTSIPIIVKSGDVVVASEEALDVNGDTVIDLQDLAIVATHFGAVGEDPADVNGDSVVDIKDLLLVAGSVNAEAAAPSVYPQTIFMLTAEDIQVWLEQAQGLSLSGAIYEKGILVLKLLMEALTPKETMLLPNYPNPFNPETWIPYQLETDRDVLITIYDMKGTLVRTLPLGYQSAGYYTGRDRAAHWDGRNELGEPIASGVYFYTITAGDFTATRKMLIRK